MAQGDWLVGAWSEKVDKRLGPALCNTEDPHCPIFRVCTVINSEVCVLFFSNINAFLQVILPDFEAIVIFPPVQEDYKRRVF